MNLRNFAEIIEADEVLLFERATFLVRTFCSVDVLHISLPFSNREQHVATYRKNFFPSRPYLNMFKLVSKIRVVLSTSDLKKVLW